MKLTTFQQLNDDWVEWNAGDKVLRFGQFMWHKYDWHRLTWPELFYNNVHTNAYVLLGYYLIEIEQGDKK